MIRIGLMCGTALLVTSPVFAALNFTGSPIVENFDGLPNTPSGPVTPAPFSSTIGAQFVVPGTTFDAAKIVGTGTTAMPFTVDAGGGSSGGIYSYGNAAGNSERALGTLASGSNTPAFGVEIVNNLSVPQFALAISFTQENWRSSTSQLNTVNAQWAVGSPAITSANYLTAAGFTDVDALDLVGPAPVASPNGSLDGNDPLNQAARSAVIEIPGGIPAGGSFFLRFQDFDNTGSDAGLAIDNFRVVPEPATLTALAAVGLMGLRRRRA